MCILNGRPNDSNKNDFTSISTKGTAVGDYFLVPPELIRNYCAYNNF